MAGTQIADITAVAVQSPFLGNGARSWLPEMDKTVARKWRDKYRIIVTMQADIKAH